MTHSWMLADCLVLSGSAADVVGEARAHGGAPRALLLHGRKRRTHASLVLGDLSRGSDLSALVDADGHAVALAAPLARVAGDPLSSVTELAPTPLVGASRVLLERLERHFLSHDLAHAVPLEDALVSLLRAILTEHPESVDPTSHAAPLGTRVELLIELRHTDPRLDVAHIARELHTSRRHLYRHSGDAGIATMLSRRRVETAQALLRSPSGLTIAEIATRSGFTSAAHLRAQLARWTGQTPTEYRRDRLSGPAEGCEERSEGGPEERFGQSDDGAGDARPPAAT